MADAAMLYVRQTLGSDDSLAKLDCLNKLRVLALALGAEKTRLELLPYLMEVISNKEDKVCVCVCARARACVR